MLTFFFQDLIMNTFKKSTFLSVNVFNTKVLTGDTILRLLLYVVIQATRRSRRLQGKGSIFISQLF